MPYLEKHVVTVIIPSTEERDYFNERIIETFNRQDYPYKQLLFDLGEGTIGAKRNRLCQKAYGEIILHMDSDDRYADDWITQSLTSLFYSNAGITGLSALNFYSAKEDAAWRYYYPPNKSWIAGATMCYWKWVWEQSPFAEINIGEDNLFAKNNCCKPHDYIMGFLSDIHAGNTSPKLTYNAAYTMFEQDKLEELKKHWKIS
jgi:hypothetical protein